MTAFRTHLASGVTTVCRAWSVTLSNGRVLGFTDHDQAITVDGVECLAESGMTAGALQQTTGLSVDNAQATGALSHDAVNEDDIRAGDWDGAAVTAYLVNWQDNSEFEVLFRGSIGEISWGDGRFSAELRGLADALNNPRGRVYQSRCDAVFGDNRCRASLDARFVVETDVLEVVDGRDLIVPAFDTYAPKWFSMGEAEFLSGDAVGVTARIKLDRSVETGRMIGLWTSLRRPIAPGDRLRLTAGCDKRKATCRDKFDNLLNFRGFPDIPGEDWLMAYPVRDGRNDGSKL